jgi:hypothetical protein
LISSAKRLLQQYLPKAEISDSAQLTHRDQKKSIFQL